MSALSIKHRYCTRRLSELLDLKKLNNINKGFFEVMSTIKKINFFFAIDKVLVN
jgi:hypothetical protein